MAEAPLVEAIGLTKTYGEITAVDSIDLTVSAGEVFGLLGPNGAGKTTAVLMLLGLSEPTAGIIMTWLEVEFVDQELLVHSTTGVKLPTVGPSEKHSSLWRMSRAGMTRDSQTVGSVSSG